MRPGHLGLLGFVAHGDERSPPKVTARKRSIMASTCLGTSSWQKCPEPTVLPYRIWGNISWKRPMSERGCSPSLGLYRYAYLRRSVSSEID